MSSDENTSTACVAVICCTNCGFDATASVCFCVSVLPASALSIALTCVVLNEVLVRSSNAVAISITVSVRMLESVKTIVVDNSGVARTIVALAGSVATSAVAVALAGVLLRGACVFVGKDGVNVAFCSPSFGGVVIVVAMTSVAIVVVGTIVSIWVAVSVSVAEGVYVATTIAVGMEVAVGVCVGVLVVVGVCVFVAVSVCVGVLVAVGVVVFVGVAVG